MIEKDTDKEEEKRRRKRTCKKWNRLLHRCEQASKVVNNKMSSIETTWHINIEDAFDCISHNAEGKLMELKQAIIEIEQSYVQELDVLHIQAKEVLRWHHAIPRFNRQCITKNLQKLKSNASTIEEKVTSVSHSNLQALLEAMGDTLNEKFVSYLLIYCENIGELRALFKQKMRRDFEFCRLLFSSYFQIERSLLPIHRVSKLHSLLKEILELLKPINHLNNSSLYNQAVLLEAKLSEIVVKCHEVTHSILGSNYMNNILQALFPCDLKLQDSIQSPETGRKNLKDGSHNVFMENGLKKSSTNDLKSFTDEVLNTSLHKTDIHYTGSKEDLASRNQCDNIKTYPRLNPATSTESIFYDSESSGILKAIEQSALKLQLKTEDDDEEEDEKEEAKTIERLQRRRRTISEREARCAQRFAEILQKEEEEMQRLGQTAAESPEVDSFDNGLKSTECFDQNSAGCQCGESGSAQKLGRNGECSYGMIIWDRSRVCSGADAGSSPRINIWNSSDQSLAQNAGSFPRINIWNSYGEPLEPTAGSSPRINIWNSYGEPLEQIAGSSSGVHDYNDSGTMQNSGPSLDCSWRRHGTASGEIPDTGHQHAEHSSGISYCETQSSEPNSWRQFLEDSGAFPVPGQLSWTDASGSDSEVIEMKELSVSAPGRLDSKVHARNHPIGDELLRMLETSFGCKPRCEEKEEEEEEKEIESDPPNSTHSDEGHRVGDSSIFYDLPSDSSSPKEINRTSWESSEDSVIDEDNKAKQGGKRMKRVSEVLQRTLWEETDRVVQENVLGNMTKADIALQESKFEILTSELSYLNSLNILVTVFMNSKELSSILSKSDEESLFKHIIKVKKASELFLYDLAGQWEEDIFLSGIYCEIEKHSRTSLQVYVDYCSNQVNLHRTLQRLLLEDEKFVELTSYLQRSSECFGNSLNSFLMLPMQRVTRLPLLLQTIERRLPADSDEKKECQLTLDSLHKLVHECNEAVRDAENESCIEDKYGHKKKLSLNSLEPLTPKASHRKWSLFNIREIKLNG